MTEGMLRLRRLAAERLLISHSVFRRPSLLLEALRAFVKLFISIQLLGVCGWAGFLQNKTSYFPIKQPVHIFCTVP